MNNSELIIYQTDDGRTRIETRLEDETVWLTEAAMAELFQNLASNINEHLLNVYARRLNGSGENRQFSTKRKFLTTLTS
ncbi:MAG: hypothetical protein IPM21_02630 [Acidobacteria bacterium]|nr:hypothetical protein [Acidobacteriota bacterium]